jgi:hypothetical protein
MRPEVQVLPGPPPTLTSGNAGGRVRRPVAGGCAGSRTLTWLPLLVMSQTVTSLVVPRARTSSCEPSQVLRRCTYRSVRVARPRLVVPLAGALSSLLRHALQACGSETPRRRSHEPLVILGPMGSRRWANTARRTWPRGAHQPATAGAKVSCWAWCWAASGEGCRQTGFGLTPLHDDRTHTLRRRLRPRSQVAAAVHPLRVMPAHPRQARVALRGPLVGGGSTPPWEEGATS